MPGKSSENVGLHFAPRVLTGDEISREPLGIVVANPVGERKQTVDPERHITRSGRHMSDPLERGGLFLYVGIRRGDGECRFSSGHAIICRGIAVVELNPQHFCQYMANTSRHPHCLHLINALSGGRVRLIAGSGAPSFTTASWEGSVSCGGGGGMLFEYIWTRLPSWWERFEMQSSPRIAEVKRDL